MNRRQELCRNFQRGSCKYGAQCRYLHVSPQQQQQQQQAKPNPFGFGTASRQQQFGGPGHQQQQQQQKPNPFGFGVQNAGAQSRNASDASTRFQGHVKPFENKWVRNSSAPSKQAEVQPPQAALHTSCTDPESCKQQTADDFKNEAPLWKLTCYGHRKSGPCDITGDISFEELRSKAYEEARQRHSLQSIVEGERNLQNAKLIEFTNLLNSPRASQTPSFPMMGASPEVKNNSSFGGSQSNAPPVFTSFSQIGAATRFGSGFGTTTLGVPTTSLFGQSNQPEPSQKVTQTFGRVEMNFGAPGAFGSQTLKQPSGSLHGSSMPNFSTFQTSPAGHKQSPMSSAHLGNIDRQSLELLNGTVASSNIIDQTSAENKKDETQDDSIWLKERWSIGEIPREEPPQRHISHVF